MHYLRSRVISYSAIFLLVTGGVAQTSSTHTSAPSIDEMLARSKGGESAATVDLTNQLFRNVAIPTDMASALGFTDRIIAAEMSYRRGERAGIDETKIVSALNNLATALDAPAWVRTDISEVKRVRMIFMVTAPHLVGDEQPPDAKGHYRALRKEIGPLEASHIATMLLYQKAFNVDYQATREERADLARTEEVVGTKQTALKLRNLHEERTDALQHLLQGRTQNLSVRDLLSASDRLFNDLNIEATPQSGAVASLLATPVIKGR